MTSILFAWIFSCMFGLSSAESEGLTYAAHLCYVAALEELQTCQESSFDLIGCDRYFVYVCINLYDYFFTLATETSFLYQFAGRSVSHEGSY